MKITLPNDVIDIINELENSGHSAYIVGGCVRDAIMGKEPHDYDICTSATPDEMLEIFAKRRVIETGLQHGTLTVGGKDDYYEVTTFRVDGEYTDGRHPDGVVFVDNIEADLARRDFTVNAMAYNPKAGLIDPFGGQSDIQNKIIRCVGKPDCRFSEDALRIMRATRFSATCGFDIEPATKQSMLKNRNLLASISAERKMGEFSKMLVRAEYPLLDTYKDIFATFIPEIKDTFYFAQNNRHHKYDVYEHIARATASASNDLITRLALFFHDIAKPLVYTFGDDGQGHFYGHATASEEMAHNIMKRMRYDNATIQQVSELVGLHDVMPSTEMKFARRMLNRIGYEQCKRLIEVHRCDKKAQSFNKDTQKGLADLDVWEKNLDEIISQQQCISKKDLVLTAYDLMNMGIPQDRRLGEAINYLLNAVIDNPELNNKESLASLVEQYKANAGLSER